MVRVSVILDGSVMASALAFLGVMTAAVSVNNQMDAVTTGMDCVSLPHQTLKNYLVYILLLILPVFLIFVVAF